MKKKLVLGIVGVIVLIAVIAGVIIHNLNSKNEYSDISEFGISLSTTNVTPTGLTIVCKQSAENVSGELYTGEEYSIEKLLDGVWTDVDYSLQKSDFGWDDVALIVNHNGNTEWDIDWEWLYGELTAGEYRIEKEFLNGDTEKAICYAYFEIK